MQMSLKFVHKGPIDSESELVQVMAWHSLINKLLITWSNDAQILWCHIDGLVQDCSNSSVLAVDLLQSCTKLSIWRHEATFVFIH